VREFLGLLLTQRAPDDSSLTVIRQRFPVELFEEVFRYMILIARKKKLLRGQKIAIDATNLEANAAMRSIVSREEGVSWRRYVKELAEKEGIAHASQEDARRFDRHRRDKKVSNRNWVSPTDPDSRIARMKDGRTHLAYKAEHAVDLESEIIVAATLHPADQSDAKTLPDTLIRAQANLELAGSETTVTELVADKGYHAARRSSGAIASGPDLHPRAHRVAAALTDAVEFQSAVYANRRRGSSEGSTPAEATQRTSRTQLRACLQQRWTTSNDGARARGNQQALPLAHRRTEPRDPDEEALRDRNAEGVGSVVEVAAICASGTAGHPGGRH
jgi:transposase